MSKKSRNCACINYAPPDYIPNSSYCLCFCRFEGHLLSLVQTKTRQESLLSPTNVGRLRAVHDDRPIFQELRDTLLKITAFENRFIAVAKVLVSY